MYFFGQKMEFFSFQNIPKQLDLSYKEDITIDGWFVILRPFQ